MQTKALKMLKLRLSRFILGFISAILLVIAAIVLGIQILTMNYNVTLTYEPKQSELIPEESRDDYYKYICGANSRPYTLGHLVCYPKTK